MSDVEVKPEEIKPDPVQEAIHQLNLEYTNLCAELGNKIFVEAKNKKIEAEIAKAKADLISRIETINNKAASLKANQKGEKQDVQNTTEVQV